MTPSASSGSSSFFRRPAFALLIGLAAVAIGALIGVSFRPQSGPVWLGSAVALAVVSAPALVAAGVAARVAARPGFWRRLLLDARWIDVAWGIAVGLALRAVVEIVVPTTGSLGDGFVEPSLLDIAVVVLGAALIAPIVEEILFRGILVAALSDVLRPIARPLAGVIAITIPTALFVMLHALTLGPSPIESLLAPLGVSVATGILFLTTRRLAPAIVTHVVFNAIGVALLLV